jgi:hypothetical protein
MWSRFVHVSLFKVPRHPAFRLFACMNPPTDVGKRPLPPGVRARYDRSIDISLARSIEQTETYLFCRYCLLTISFVIRVDRTRRAFFGRLFSGFRFTELQCPEPHSDADLSLVIGSYLRHVSDLLLFVASLVFLFSFLLSRFESGLLIRLPDERRSIASFRCIGNNTLRQVCAHFSSRTDDSRAITTFIAPQLTTWSPAHARFSAALTHAQTISAEQRVHYSLRTLARAGLWGAFD